MPNFLFHETSPLLFISSLVCVRAKFLHLCLTLCDPMNCSLLGSSVHGISQARILEWVPFLSPRTNDYSAGDIQPYTPYIHMEITVTETLNS